MVAGRTYFRSLGSDDDMSAVAAFPDLDFGFLEYSLCFNILQQRSVSFLMMFLDRADQSELLSQFRETFLISSLGETFIQICPFIVFAFGCSLQVLGC